MSKQKNRLDWSVFAHGAPGRSARLKGGKEALKHIWPALLLLLVVMPLISIFSIFGRNPGFSGWLVSMFILSIVFAKKLEKKSDAAMDPWLKGARGERLVAEALRQIESENFRVIHDLPNGRGNIDHVVIGRTGLFVIETKANEGRIHYTGNCLCRNGHRFDRDPLKQVRRQAAQLADKLRPLIDEHLFVNPILCFTNAWVDVNALTVERVRVTRPQFLSKIVREGKPKLSRDEVEMLAAALQH